MSNQEENESVNQVKKALCSSQLLHQSPLTHRCLCLKHIGSPSSIGSTPSFLSLSSDFKLSSQCLPELLELPLIGLSACTFLSLKTILTTAGRILFLHVRRLFLFSDKTPSCHLLCFYRSQSPSAVLQASFDPGSLAVFPVLILRQ